MSSSSESKKMRERNNQKDPPPLLLSHNFTHSTISRQQQQQQNNICVGGGGAGVAEGSDSKRVRIRQQQQRLQLLLHVSKCTHTTLCTTRFCAQTKPLWQHMKTCRNYKNCSTKHCQSSRSILTHYRMCQSQGKASTCEICGPVVDREQHNNNNIRKKTKREGTVNTDQEGLVTVNTVNSTNNNNNSNNNKRQTKMTMKMKIPALKSSTKGTSTKIQRRNNNMNPPSSLLLPSPAFGMGKEEATATATAISASLTTGEKATAISTSSSSETSISTSTATSTTTTLTSTSTLPSLVSGMTEEVMATEISTSSSAATSMSTPTAAAEISTATSTATTTATTVVVAVNPPLHDVFKLMDLPLPIRLDISNYAGEKQEDLIAFTLVSKQFNHDCQQPGIEWTIVPRMVIRPITQQQRGGGGSTRTLLMNLRQQLMNNVTYQKSQRYRFMIVKDSYKFGDIPFEKYEFIRITNNIRLDRIVKLDLSHRSHSISIYDSLPFALCRILPNLQELDLSNNGYHRTSGNNRILSDFSIHCPQLEKITWDHIDAESCIALNGYDMSKTTLRELMMDHSTFDGSYVEVTLRMSDLNSDNPTYNRQFPFCCCCKSLERVSILDAKWSKINRNTNKTTSRVLPQNALIKFVRNVPTLRWFRSDLTKENRDMLQLERPGIEFISSSNNN